MRTGIIVVIAIVVIAIIAAGVYVITLNTTTTGTTTSGSTSLTSTSSSSTACAPYNIGMMEDETGSVATFANESIHMAQIAVNQIDAAGGVNCHLLKLFTASEVPSAQAAANTLILQDNVSALIGITYAGDAEALFPFLASHHVVTIMTTASNNGLLQNLTTDYSAYQYFFRITSNDTGYAQSAINFSASVLKPTSFYFVAEDLAFSHELFQNLSNFASGQGLTVAGSTFVPLSQTDFSTTASAVVAANPGLVIDCQTGSGAGSFIKDLRANPSGAGIKVLYMCNGALADPGFQGYLESQGTSLNGIVFQIEASTASVPLNNVSTYVATQYHQTMGPFYPYYSFVSNDYSAVQILATAIKQAGSTNASAVINALQTVSYVGPTGTVQFNSLHIWTPQFWYTQIQNSTEKVIYPTAYANGSYNATA
jgi:ABC-type branched-subunit amino acid transport system substrate-binding protein